MRRARACWTRQRRRPTANCWPLIAPTIASCLTGCKSSWEVRRFNIPTDERLTKYNTNDDPGLAALYFQFGRYLLMACSRPGTQPFICRKGIWEPRFASALEQQLDAEL